MGSCLFEKQGQLLCLAIKVFFFLKKKNKSPGSGGQHLHEYPLERWKVRFSGPSRPLNPSVEKPQIRRSDTISRLATGSLAIRITDLKASSHLNVLILKRTFNSLLPKHPGIELPVGRQLSRAPSFPPKGAQPTSAPLHPLTRNSPQKGIVYVPNSPKTCWRQAYSFPRAAIANYLVQLNAFSQFWG